MAGSWLKCSPYMERTRVMSSATSPRWGSSSESSIPQRPCRLNSYGEGSSPPHLVGEFDLVEDVPGGRASRQPGQLRLGVEQVDLAGSAVHEQVDHRLGPGPVMGSPGLQVMHRVAGQRRIGGEEVLSQQAGQGPSRRGRR